MDQIMRDVFSPMEIQIIKILGKRKMPIQKLTDKYLERNLNEALSPSNVIAGSIKRINMKCKRHGFKWGINGSGSGRSGKTVWIDTSYGKN